jgi:serine/threonine protein kinase
MNLRPWDQWNGCALVRLSQASVMDIRSDLYSLGVTLWVMVTGQTPFRGPSAEVMYQHQHTPLPWTRLIMETFVVAQRCQHILFTTYDRGVHARKVLAVVDLADYEPTSALRRDLEQLSNDSGAKLLRALGVKGHEAELRSASNEFRGHCLALTLLGSYLNDAY